MNKNISAVFTMKKLIRRCKGPFLLALAGSPGPPASPRMLEKPSNRRVNSWSMFVPASWYSKLLCGGRFCCAVITGQCCCAVVNVVARWPKLLRGGQYCCAVVNVVAR